MCRGPHRDHCGRRGVLVLFFFFFFQAEDGIRDVAVTGVQTCALPIFIGGGPAGSTASTLIAQKGYRVELFERETFPRFHIGESLIPQTYWVLKRLEIGRASCRERV